MPQKYKQHSDIWQTINKIRVAIFRSGVDLWMYFLPLDPQRYKLITEGNFTYVLTGPLRNVVRLSEQEISELTSYFKACDGRRVLYQHFCQAIYDNEPDFNKCGPQGPGLNWEDPDHVNTLSTSEERKVSMLLTKIATMVKARDLILLPYFQDYEMKAKKNSTITVFHFAQVLHFLKIFLAPEEFWLLVHKFRNDRHTVNYIAFLSALESVYKYMEGCGITDFGGEVLPHFQGQVFPKLPRPQVGRVPIPTDTRFGVESIFRSVLNKQRETEILKQIIQRVCKHICSKGIQITEIFKVLDPTCCGRLPEAKFRQCLDMMGVGESGNNLSQEEIDKLVDAYCDPTDPFNCLWWLFQEDVASNS